MFCSMEADLKSCLRRMCHMHYAYDKDLGTGKKDLGPISESFLRTARLGADAAFSLHRVSFKTMASVAVPVLPDGTAALSSAQLVPAPD